MSIPQKMYKIPKAHYVEQDIQRAILNFFNMFGVAVKTGSGGLKVGTGDNSRFVKMSSGFNGGRGWVDIIWVYKCKVYLCEIKTPSGQLSDSQKIMHEAIKNQGVAVHVLRSLDDAQRLKNLADNIL